MQLFKIPELFSNLSTDQCQLSAHIAIYIYVVTSNSAKIGWVSLGLGKWQKMLIF